MLYQLVNATQIYGQVETGLVQTVLLCTINDPFSSPFKLRFSALIIKLDWHLPTTWLPFTPIIVHILTILHQVSFWLSIFLQPFIHARTHNLINSFMLLHFSHNTQQVLKFIFLKIFGLSCLISFLLSHALSLMLSTMVIFDTIDDTVANTFPWYRPFPRSFLVLFKF